MAVIVATILDRCDVFFLRSVVSQQGWGNTGGVLASRAPRFHGNNNCNLWPKGNNMTSL